MKESDTDSNTKDESQKKYELLLEHCWEDSKRQEERKKNIDTKTSYLLVLTTFLFGVALKILAMINWSGSLHEISLLLLIGRICFILFFVGTITLFCISIFLYSIVLIDRKYEKIDPELFDIEKSSELTYDDILKKLTSFYKQIITINSKINDKVIKKYKIATILLIIAMFLTLVIYMMAYIL